MSRLLSALDGRVQVEADRRHSEFLKRFLAYLERPEIITIFPGRRDKACMVETLVRSMTSYHKLCKRAMEHVHDEEFSRLVDGYAVVLERIGMPEGCGGFHRLRKMGVGERDAVLQELKEIVPRLEKRYNHYRPRWFRTWTSDAWIKNHFHR